MGLLAFEVPIEVLVGADRFETEEPYDLIEGVTQQVKLILAVKLADIQVRQVPFLALADRGVFGDFGRCRIDIGGDVVVQLLVDARKAAGLLQLIANVRRLLGTKGVVASRDSAIDASDSAMKLTGRSGLSRAARPTLSQYST